MRISVVCMLTVLGATIGAPSSASAQDDGGAAQVWTGRRADTLPKGRWEVGVFGPLKYAVTDDIELSTHPLAFFVLPNVTAKISWNDDRPWRFATRHGLHYPSIALRILSKEGTGGILPADTEVPDIVGFTNEVLATTNVPLFRRWFTVRLGFTVAARFGGEPLPAMELPILFPRTAAYSSWGTGHAGLALEGEIVGPVYYLIDTTMFVIPGFEGAFAFENTAQISWRPNERIMITGGARAIYAGYPIGERLHVLPVVDLKFGF